MFALSIRTKNVWATCVDHVASDQGLHSLQVTEQFSDIQWTLVTTTAFVPEEFAIKRNLLL